MKKQKLYFIICIVAFIIIDLITGLILFIDNFGAKSTIQIRSQDDYIVREIKEHFNIDYNIMKVSFVASIPDGYYLDLYDFEGNVEKVFEDRHEDSEVYDYFKYIKVDKSKYKNYLCIEFTIEFLILIVWNFITLSKTKIKNQKI